MTKWYSTQDTYWRQRDKVQQLCTELFGPENETVVHTITKRTSNNHGRWELRGNVKFRYEKDLTFFLLKAINLADTMYYK